MLRFWIWRETEFVQIKPTSDLIDVDDPDILYNDMLKPDIVLYENRFLFLRGVERKSRMELQDAKYILKEILKMWTKCKVLHGPDYIFGFVCAGEHFQLYVMSRCGRLIELLRPLDLKE
jgi:hypothetical protein